MLLVVCKSLTTVLVYGINLREQLIEVVADLNHGYVQVIC
jgi:hypothetical protein